MEATRVMIALVVAMTLINTLQARSISIREKRSIDVPKIVALFKEAIEDSITLVEAETQPSKSFSGECDEKCQQQMLIHDRISETYDTKTTMNFS